MEALEENGPVLVDTSAWINVLRRGPSLLRDPLRDLVTQRRVRFAGPVIAELLAGVRPGEESELTGLLENIEVLPEPAGLWEKAGWLCVQMRRRGRTLSLVDALIAIYAREHRCLLMALDDDFSDLTGVRLWRPRHS